MALKSPSDVWWQNAIIYCLDVETFADSNSDGIGDFQGLTERTDYLAGLGVSCLWLMPFYETPNRDDGYDICNFYNVDPRLGTLGDFVEFIEAANERGMRVMCDLVVNHTSTQHPWFQSARSDPDSPYRDWYVWSDDKRDDPEQIIFPNVEDSNWEYDEEAGMYYLHRFYAEQPDLNTANPEVIDEICRIMAFWLQLGVSGFRVDAVPYLIEQLGPEQERYAHDLLRSLRRFMQRRRGDSVLLGEVNLEPSRTPKYFGEGDELTLISNFFGNGKLFLALSRGNRDPLVEMLNELPEPPDDCQWANFVSNHDEANYSRLPDDEREELLAAYAPEESMRLYGRGIRRRTFPMVDGDERRYRLLHSLMLSLPGTPTLYYGDEIGMGDEQSLPDRLPVRTPMQWSARSNGGFSAAAPEDLVRPVVDDGPYSYEKVNVETQRHHPDSLLNWFERALRSRRETPEFGLGDAQVLDVDADEVFAVRYDWGSETVLAVHNLADADADIELDLGDEDVEGFSDIFADQEYDALEGAVVTSTLPAYGFRWLRATRPSSPRSVR